MLFLVFTAMQRRNAVAPSTSFLDEGTVSFAFGTESLLSRDCRDNFQQIPFRRGLFGRLDLQQIEPMNLASILSDGTLAEQRIIGRDGLHRRDNGLSVAGASCLVHSLEIVKHRGIDACLHVLVIIVL